MYINTINNYFSANGVAISKITSENAVKFYKKINKLLKTDAQIQKKFPE